MKAMIFAAGIGSRLKPFTLKHPKALVPVGGIPMLQRVIGSIADAGITEIVVNVHHFAPQIIDFLHTNDNFGLDIKISDESMSLLDTGGGLLKARRLLGHHDGPVLLHNADILCDMPLTGIIEAHLHGNADVTLLCSHRKSSRTLYFNTSDNSLLGWENLSTGQRKPAGFIPAPDADATPFGGVHIINPRVFPLLEEYAGGKEMPFSIVPFYLANLSRLDIKRHLLPQGCRWFDVGSSEKLANAEKSFLI